MGASLRGSQSLRTAPVFRLPTSRVLEEALISGHSEGDIPYSFIADDVHPRHGISR